MSKQLLFLSLCLLLMKTCVLEATAAIDNRFIGTLPRLFVSVDDRPSSFAVDFFACTGKEAFGRNSEEISLGELYGVFDQGVLACAFEQAGMSNPFASTRPEWQEGSFIWNVHGKIQGHGIQITYDQSIHPYISVGGNIVFMRTHAHHRFSFKSSTVVLDQNDAIELDDIRRSMNEMIGLSSNSITQSGCADFDLYIRLKNTWHYPLLFQTIGFRTIRADAQIGMLIPSWVTDDASSPAAIPFGANGHWGIYGKGDAEIELKEDFKVGLSVLILHRFKKTRCRRVPISTEHPLYGVIRTNVVEKLGITAMVCSYVQLENLREGFGLRLRYAITHHAADKWCATEKTCVSNEALERTRKYSRWSSDYLSVAGFYDFGKMKTKRQFEPVVTLAWDIPFSAVWGEQFVKTHRVSLGIEYNF